LGGEVPTSEEEGRGGIGNGRGSDKKGREMERKWDGKGIGKGGEGSK